MLQYDCTIDDDNRFCAIQPWAFFGLGQFSFHCTGIQATTVSPHLYASGIR